MTMNQVSDVVKKFFEDFERASNTFEGDRLALQFSDPLWPLTRMAAYRL